MFKIQKINTSSQLQSKTIRINKLPIVNINIQSMSTLNYQIDTMLQIIQSIFIDEHNDKNMIVKTLKIVSVSLSDHKLVSKLQSILNNHTKKSQQMYLLFSLWTTIHQNIQTILSKISSKLRKQLILTIFSFYFLKNNNLEEGIKKNISKLLTLIDKDSLINELKKKYNDWGQPLKSSIKKCMTIKTQNIGLKQFIIKWIEYMLEFSQNKVLELVQNIDNNKQIMDYLILNIPKMSSNFIKHIKKIINQNNVMKMGSKNIKIKSIFRSAVQEWVNQGHNYWKVIDQHYGIDNFPQKVEILKLGKLLNKQFHLSQSLTIKYLYHYFQSQRIEFDKEDRLVALQPHQSWIDVYRSIYQCVSYRQLNLIIINVNSAPKIWKQQNPFKMTVKNKPFQKFINKFADFYDQKLKQYGQKNKKIELAFNTFLIYLKDRGSYITVTFQQLKNYTEQGKPIDNISFREVYQPFVEELAKPKQEIRKQHNIIIEAKLVKLLKRHKECLTIDAIIKQTTYSQQIVELALKRLINKGLAQMDDKNKDAYIYVP